MAKLLRTMQRVEELEERLREARQERREDLRRAHDEGESISELSRRLGLSRTRITQLLRDK